MNNGDDDRIPAQLERAPIRIGRVIAIAMVVVGLLTLLQLLPREEPSPTLTGEPVGISEGIEQLSARFRQRPLGERLVLSLVGSTVLVAPMVAIIVAVLAIRRRREAPQPPAAEANRHPKSRSPLFGRFQTMTLQGP